MARKKKSKKSRAKAGVVTPGPQPTPVAETTPSKSTRRLLRELLFWCGAALVVFLVYSNSLNGPFLFDDTNNIRDNSAIKLTSLSPESIASAGFDSPHPRRFVAYISFALNYYFHQDRMPGYHVVNILIHFITGVLVYYFTVVTLSSDALRSRYPRQREIALCVATLWLVHPMAAQSVAYLVQRMNSLATMFYMLSLLSYALGRRSKQVAQSVSWFTASAIAGALAFGSKETAATLPFFILLYEWFFFQNQDSRWLKRNVPLLAALVAVLGIAGMVATGGNLEAGFDNRTFTLTQRVMTEFRVVMLYLSLLLYPQPSRLTINHDISPSHGILDPSTTLLSMLAVIGLLLLAACTARRERLLSFCIFWYFGQLVIESSVLPLELMFEHRTYLPSVGLWLMAVAMFYRFTRAKKYQLIPLGLLAVLWAVWAHERSGIWSDKVIFWSDAIEKTPKVARLYNNLGVALEERGQLDAALGQYDTAFSLDPGLYRALNNIGSIHLEQKNYAAALRAFEQSRDINPKDVDAYKGLALTYYAMKDQRHYLENLEKVRAIQGHVDH